MTEAAATQTAPSTATIPSAKPPKIDVFKPMSEQPEAQAFVKSKIEALSPSNDAQPAVEKPIAAVETPTPPAEIKPDEQQSAKFAALAKKEREVLKRELEVKEKMRQVDAYEQDKKLAKDNPLEFMKKHEVSYDDITRMIINDGKVTPEQQYRKLEEEVVSLRKQMETEKSEALRIKNEAAVNTFRSSIKDLVAKEKEKFPLIGAFEDEETVYNVVREHWNNQEVPEQERTILSIEQAAELTEQAYKERLGNFLKKPELRRYLLNELGVPSEGGGALDSSTKPESQTNEAVKPSTQTQIKPVMSQTLTNALAQDLPQRQERTLTREERLRLAAQHLRWNDD